MHACQFSENNHILVRFESNKKKASSVVQIVDDAFKYNYKMNQFFLFFFGPLVQ